MRLLSMAGRDDVFALLAKAWKDTLNGNPRLAIITGEPGSGKTRLVQDLYLRFSRPPREGELGIDADNYWPDLVGVETMLDNLTPVLPDTPHSWRGCGHRRDEGVQA